MLHYGQGWDAAVLIDNDSFMTLLEGTFFHNTMMISTRYYIM